MTHARLSALLFLAALGLCDAGNAFACNANEGKLQALRRGMTYREAAEVMGCTGTILTPLGPESDGYATVEWNGSEMAGVTYTQVDFQQGRLLSFTTRRRAGL